MSVKKPSQPRSQSRVSPPASQQTRSVAVVALLPLEDIDRQTAELENRLAELEKQRKIHEFSADPDAYEQRLLRGAAPDVRHKDNPLQKPAGTHRTLSTLIMEVFNDFPNVEFSAGTMVSKLVDRGWVTRCRDKIGIVGTNFSILCSSGDIVRVSRGVYKKS